MYSARHKEHINSYLVVTSVTTVLRYLLAQPRNKIGVVIINLDSCPSTFPLKATDLALINLH